MNDPIQIIRESTAALKEKLRGQHERVKRNMPFSLVQHVEDCEALLKRIDELEELRALRD